MKTYTIIGGVNGVGKSSLTGVLRRELDDLGIVIDVDQLTAAQGGDPFAGGKAAIRKIENCLKKGICFTQETTLSGGRTERTVQKAKEELEEVLMDIMFGESAQTRLTTNILRGIYMSSNTRLDRKSVV